MTLSLGEVSLPRVELEKESHPILIDIVNLTKEKFDRGKVSRSRAWFTLH